MAELTDADWDELARDLSARVAVFAPDWTDRNDADPGITLVELFAFLAESALYRPDASPAGRARLQEIAAYLGRLHRTPCPDGTLVRNRYFTGKLLTADDLEQEQEYLRTKHRRHNRLLHGYGIVSGLDVSVDPGGSAIVISPGVAINGLGEELLVCEPVKSDPCDGKIVCHVVVRLLERPTTVDTTGEPSRIEETAEVAVVEDVVSGDLPIARLVRAGDAWQVDPTFTPARVR